MAESSSLYPSILVSAKVNLLSCHQEVNITDIFAAEGNIPQATSIIPVNPLPTLNIIL